MSVADGSELANLLATLNSLADAPETTYVALAEAVGPAMQLVSSESGMGRQLKSLENTEGYEWLFGWTPEARKQNTVSRTEVVKAIALVTEQIELSRRKKARNRTRNERRHKKRAENAAAAHGGADSARGAANPANPAGPTGPVMGDPLVAPGPGLTGLEAPLSAVPHGARFSVSYADGGDSDSSVASDRGSFDGRPQSRSEEEASRFLERLNDALNAAHLVVDTANAVAAGAMVPAVRASDVGHADMECKLAAAQAELLQQRLEIEALRRQVAEADRLRASALKLSQICFSGLPDGYGAVSPPGSAVTTPIVDLATPFAPIVPDPTPLGQRKAPHRTAPHDASGWVYILWDIENIAIPRVLGNTKQGVTNGAYRVVNAIRDQLKKRGVMSDKTREFFKLFYRPNNVSLASNSLRDLQRAGVELIATVSEKQEAADRLLEHEVKKLCRGLTEAHDDMLKLRQRLDHVGGQLAQLGAGVCDLPDNFDGKGSQLKAQRSTIVLISSDLDFLKPMEMAYGSGFRIIVVHDEGLDGDRREAYMRHCHAKMFLWSDLLGKLYQEAEVERKENDLKKAQPFRFDKLEADEMIPVQRMLVEFVRQHPAASRIERTHLVELLNYELGRRLPEDDKAIEVIETKDAVLKRHSASGDASDNMVAVDILADNQPRLLLPSSTKALKHYLRRVEDSSDGNLFVTDPEQQTHLIFNRAVLLPAAIEPEYLLPGRTSLRSSSRSASGPSRSASRSVSSASTGSPASQRRRSPVPLLLGQRHAAPSRHSSSSTILIDQNLFDFDTFGLMATGKQTPPPPEMREGSISPGTPEWESMQAPGAVKVQKALAKWEDGCSATVTGSRTVRSLDESDYTVYIVQVIGPAQSYEVERRFTEFKELREAIAKTELAATLEQMPEKRLFKFAQDTIDERIASFSKLLEQVQGLDDVECGPLLKFLTDL